MGYFQIKLLLYLCNVFVCFRLFFSLQLCLVYMVEYGTGYYFVANTEIIQDSIFCVFFLFIFYFQKCLLSTNITYPKYYSIINKYSLLTGPFLCKTCTDAVSPRFLCRPTAFMDLLQSYSIPLPSDGFYGLAVAYGTASP